MVVLQLVVDPKILRLRLVVLLWVFAGKKWTIEPKVPFDVCQIKNEPALKNNDETQKLQPLHMDIVAQLTWSD